MLPFLGKPWLVFMPRKLMIFCIKYSLKHSPPMQGGGGTCSQGSPPMQSASPHAVRAPKQHFQTEHANNNREGTVSHLSGKCTVASVHAVHHFFFLIVFSPTAGCTAVLYFPKAGIGSFPSFIIQVWQSSPHSPLLKTIEHLL